MTFIGKPAPQYANRRFRNWGAVATPGGYDPPTPYVVAWGGGVNIAYAEIPPGFQLGSGYSQRVVIHTSWTGYAGQEVYSGVAPRAPGHTLLASMDSAADTHSHYSPLTVLLWNIYVVPEPGTLSLLAFSAMPVFARRSRAFT